MAASYPGAVKTFASRSAGQTIDASHVNDLQDEVAAIEDGLLNGTASLISSNTTVQNLTSEDSTMAVGGVRYEFPSTIASSGQILTAVTVNGSTGVRLEWRANGSGSTFASLQSGNSTITALALSSAAPATPAANTLYADSIIKAWVTVSAAVAIVADVNVSAVASLNSATEASVSVSFATAMASSNYAAVVTINAADFSGNLTATVTSKTSTGCHVWAGGTGSTAHFAFSAIFVGA